MLALGLLAGCQATQPSGTASTAGGVAQAGTSTAAADSADTADTASGGGPGVVLPPTSGTFDYQLGGAYDVDGLDVVARDATESPAPGAYSICYVNGFQTQPGDTAQWRSEREDLLLHDASGELVVDPDWPDELVLDPSTQAQRDGILAVLGPVIAGCAQDGFQAVEIDNLDTWTRFTDAETGLVDEDGALALARAYVGVAHEHGLAIGQKNAAELAGAGRDLGFDFAVTEECAVYDECGVYTAAYGEHVLQIEYDDALPVPFDEVCALPDRAPLTILRDRMLQPADAGGHREQCP